MDLLRLTKIRYRLCLGRNCTKWRAITCTAIIRCRAVFQSLPMFLPPRLCWWLYWLSVFRHETFDILVTSLRLYREALSSHIRFNRSFDKLAMARIWEIGPRNPVGRRKWLSLPVLRHIDNGTRKRYVKIPLLNCVCALVINNVSLEPRISW